MFVWEKVCHGGFYSLNNVLLASFFVKKKKNFYQKLNGEAFPTDWGFYMQVLYTVFTASAFLIFKFKTSAGGKSFFFIKPQLPVFHFPPSTDVL